MTASASQRRERILDKLFEHRHLTARDLAESINVSEATVRRDLKMLAEEGLIEQVYGGATLKRASDSSFLAKLRKNTEGKQSIGRLAAGLIGDEAKLFLDSGTTCSAVAPFIKRKRGLTIIVNSARLALELDAPGLNVILLGGQYRAERNDCVGSLTESMLNELHGYICLVGADGLSMDFGLAAADSESASLYRVAVENAQQTVLLADHSKFLAPSLHKIVDWQSISRVVTDQRPTDAWMDFFASKEIAVVYPSPNEPAEAQENQSVQSS